MNTRAAKNAAARSGSSGRAVAPKAPRGEVDSLPGPRAVDEALAPVRAFMADPAFARVRGFLDRLGCNPPQVLLLEGGNADSRLAAALYWAALLNCEGEPGGAPGFPCLACSACVRMAARLHRDFFFLDGAAGSIKIDEVRALRGVLGEQPGEARYRVCVFREAQSLMEAAANALLKSFEEPRPATSFVLLAPQRERLLPTLVSRGFTLTLPWPDAKEPPASLFFGASGSGDDELAPWEAALVFFLRTGRGFFEKSGVRGAVDASLVQALAGLCRRALLKRLQSGSKIPDGEGLESLLASMPEARLHMLGEALAECQESLIHGVNPVLVLEWLVTRMFFLVPRNQR